MWLPEVVAFLLCVDLRAQISGNGSGEAAEAARASLHAGVDRGLDASGYEVLSRAKPGALGFYPDRVLVGVRKKWYPLIVPAEQTSGNTHGRAVVEFTIAKDGALGKVAVTKSSGEEALDAAATDAIRAAAPFGPLPAKFGEKSLSLRYHFAYNEEASSDRTVCEERPRVRRTRAGRKPPRVLYQPDPVYSEQARRSKYQGIVLVGATVEADGKASNLCVEQSLGQGLDEKAIAAVRLWKFEPAMENDRPVADRISVEVSFQLY